MILITTLFLGIIYPLVVTGLAQMIFPHQANGSLIRKGNEIVGSELIGQLFTSPRYFHPRPSAAGRGYDAAASGGSNLGPTNRKLIDDLQANIARAERENPGLHPGHIPADMVTASASGLDPDISVANAYIQAGRVAKARGLPQTIVRQLVTSNIVNPQLGLLGEPRVNVMKLNLALDKLGAGTR